MLFGSKDIIVADRDMVETESDDILHNAATEDISFLVVGDPFGYVLSLGCSARANPSYAELPRTPISSSAPKLSTSPRP